MGLDQFKDQNSKQMSLFDYQQMQMPTATFVPKSDFESSEWALLYAEPTPVKTPRFVTMSAVLHAAALLTITVFAIPLVPDIKSDIITVEIEDLNPPMKMALGETMTTVQGENHAAEALAKGDVTIAKVPLKEMPAKAAATVKPAAMKTAFKAVPVTIDDIDAPELDQDTMIAVAATAAPAAPLNDDDIDEDLAQVDAQIVVAVEKEKKSLNDMASALEDEQNKNLNAVVEAHNEEAVRLTSLQNSLHEKNAAAIATAEAREERARQAHQAAGDPNGVRSLDQLRQMPGNPRPQYDRQERRRGDQGEIAFVTYISREGLPTQFRMMKSTGFRNLDAKTLTALKKWRFYPGQEGWVEIPFRWDLKGGVQQDGGTLRRSASNQ